jgi:hypothetical protein
MSKANRNLIINGAMQVEAGTLVIEDAEAEG